MVLMTEESQAYWQTEEYPMVWQTMKVHTTEECESACQQLMQQNCLVGIEFDIQGNDKLLSVKVAEQNSGTLYVFDFASLGRIVFDAGLRDILEDGERTKLLYDGRNAAAILSQRYNVCMTNIRDIQILHTYTLARCATTFDSFQKIEALPSWEELMVPVEKLLPPWRTSKEHDEEFLKTQALFQCLFSMYEAWCLQCPAVEDSLLADLSTKRIACQDAPSVSGQAGSTRDYPLPVELQTVNVTHVPPDTSISTLQEYFSKFGNVVQVFHVEQDLAVVHFENAAGATAAVVSTDHSSVGLSAVPIAVDWLPSAQKFCPQYLKSPPEMSSMKNRRFAGVIRHFDASKGCGWIACGLVHHLCRMDVFMEVTCARVHDIAVGDYVTFSLDREFTSRHRQPKAKNMLLVPRARRFRGSIKSLDAWPHGFILSAEVFHRFGFGHDVIWHANDIDTFSVGQEVCFAVSLDMYGRPTATEVRPFQAQFSNAVQCISDTAEEPGESTKTPGSCRRAPGVCLQSVSEEPEDSSLSTHDNHSGSDTESCSSERAVIDQ
jgi:cold shock CspA family protein